LVSGASGTLSLHTKDNSPEAPDTNFFSVMSFTCSTLHQKLDCQNVLAQFFFKVKDKPSRWVLIVTSAAGAVNSSAESLSDILGIDYNATYIPFMISAGLISRKVHNRWKTNVLTTNIAEWKAFIGRNSLSAEISYMCCDQGSKAYYVSLGCFHHYKSFTIKQQLTEPSLVKKFSLRLPQQSFSENLASLSFDYHEDIQIPSKKKLDTTTNNFSGDGSRPEVNLLDTACHSSNVDETFVNLVLGRPIKVSFWSEIIHECNSEAEIYRRSGETIFC